MRLHIPQRSTAFPKCTLHNFSHQKLYSSVQSPLVSPSLSWSKLHSPQGLIQSGLPRLSDLHPQPPSSSPMLFQPHWPPSSSSHRPSMFLPQDLCTYFCLHTISAVLCLFLHILQVSEVFREDPLYKTEAPSPDKNVMEEFFLQPLHILAVANRIFSH